MCVKPNKECSPFLGKKVSLGLLVGILLLFVGIDGARVNSRKDRKIEEKRPNKPVVKTIMSEDGDIVDCVEIYKQPAFDHPLLRNHTIEMRPSFIPDIFESNNSLRFPIKEIWPKNRSCPEGTIPIQRVRETGLIKKDVSPKNFSFNKEFSYCKVEVARVELHRGGPYIGAQGTISVWNLQVAANEWSLNSVTMFDNEDSFFEAGWAVSQVLFNDNKPRIFVNWLSTSTGQGCFNLRCPGFVQVSTQIFLGAALPEVSQYTRDQFDSTFIIYKDAVQGKWWMVFNGEPVGYWPSVLIENFEVAPRINWGGSVCNSESGGLHTVTQMGNGHFPVEGFKKTSYIRNMMAMGYKSKFAAPSKIKYSASYPGCYGVEGASTFPGDKGPRIFYGGPGGECCDGHCSV